MDHRVIEALNSYLVAREEAGYEAVEFEVYERGGLFFLRREDLYPLTLGNKAEAITSLRRSALYIRNTPQA